MSAASVSYIGGGSSIGDSGSSSSSSSGGGGGGIKFVKNSKCTLGCTGVAAPVRLTITRGRGAAPANNRLK